MSLQGIPIYVLTVILSLLFGAAREKISSGGDLLYLTPLLCMALDGAINPCAVPRAPSWVHDMFTNKTSPECVQFNPAYQHYNYWYLHRCHHLLESNILGKMKQQILTWHQLLQLQYSRRGGKRYSVGEAIEAIFAVEDSNGRKRLTVDMI